MLGVPPYRRLVNMVFPHYALFSHLEVGGNIAYGLKQRPPLPAAAELARRVDAMLELVQLPGYGRRRVWELSGGQAGAPLQRSMRSGLWRLRSRCC
jgi:spermidine/putrescine transport system ATP-binding protein